MTVTDYFIGLEGYIGETEVIGVEGQVLAGEEDGYAILRAQATDGVNIYTIELMAPLAGSGAGGEEPVEPVDTVEIVYNDMVVAELYPGAWSLKANGGEWFVRLTPTSGVLYSEYPFYGIYSDIEVAYYGEQEVRHYDYDGFTASYTHDDVTGQDVFVGAFLGVEDNILYLLTLRTQ